MKTGYKDWNKVVKNELAAKEEFKQEKNYLTQFHNTF